jgi:hypothetical protein
MGRFVVGVIGGLLVLAGIAAAVVSTDVTAGRVFEDAASILLLVGAGLALWKVAAASESVPDVAIPPWAPGGGIVHGVPEQTVTEYPVSAQELARVIAAAGGKAREQGTIEDGLAVLGPPLRAALLDALVQGGLDRSEAERQLQTGAWTDNEWAAYVIEPSVGAPRWTLRQRFRAWLFPEATVQRLAREAVHGVARVADDAIPPVPGQGAPRTVPVATPSLADLRRGADGELQEAIDPTAIQRGPVPPTDHHGFDEGLDGTPPTDADAEDDSDGPSSGDGEEGKTSSAFRQRGVDEEVTDE